MLSMGFDLYIAGALCLVGSSGYYWGWVFSSVTIETKCISFVFILSFLNRVPLIHGSFHTYDFEVMPIYKE